MTTRETDTDYRETTSDEEEVPSGSNRRTNVEVRLGALRVPMWEVRNLALKLRVPTGSQPYSTAFWLLVALLVGLAVVVLLTG